MTGCFLLSGEHPAYSCIAWNGSQYVVSEPYNAEGAREHASWKGVPIVIHHRTLATFVREIIGSGLQLEALVEGPLNPATATDSHRDPARWYSLDRARLMPTTFIIKARKLPSNATPLTADLTQRNV